VADSECPDCSFNAPRRTFHAKLSNLITSRSFTIPRGPILRITGAFILVARALLQANALTASGLRKASKSMHVVRLANGGNVWGCWSRQVPEFALPILLRMGNEHVKLFSLQLNPLCLPLISNTCSISNLLAMKAMPIFLSYVMNYQLQFPYISILPVCSPNVVNVIEITSCNISGLHDIHRRSTINVSQCNKHFCKVHNKYQGA
jgi:hypothetical protein